MSRINAYIHSPTICAVLIGLVLAGGLLMRVYDLERDPPITVGQNSQDLVTDPPHLVSFAANKTIYDNSEPFPFPKWQVFKVSLVSGIAYPLFAIFGVSRVTAGLAGAIPAFAGIVLIVLGLWRIGRGQRYGPAAALAAAVFLGLNFVLVTFNRQPFLESGLIFYFGLIVFLYLSYRFHPFNTIVLAALVALAFLTGKAFAVTIGLALIITLLASEEESRVSKLVIFISAGVIAGGLGLLLLFGERTDAYLGYLSEQVFTAHSRPFMNLQFIEQFFGRQMIFGVTTRIFKDSPFLFISLYMVLIGLVMYARSHFREFLANRMLIFALVWLGVLFGILFLAFYRPLRYLVLLMFPTVLLLAATMTVKREKPTQAPLAISLLAALFVGILNWFFIAQVVLNLFYLDNFKYMGWTVIQYSFFPAAAATIILFLPAISRAVVRSLAVIPVIILIAAGGSIVSHSIHCTNWLDQARYTIRDTSHDLSEILGPDAVVTGPYAPVFTFDNRIHNFIYAFGLKKTNIDIFRRFPLTHLAVDPASRNIAKSDFPVLADLDALTVYSIRNFTMMIYHINGPTGNAEARAYRPSPFEKAHSLFLREQSDSALAQNRMFRQIYPRNRSGMIQHILILERLKRLGEARDVLDELYQTWPDDVAVRQFFKDRASHY